MATKQRVLRRDVVPFMQTPTNIWLAWDSEMVTDSPAGTSPTPKDLMPAYELFAELDGSDFVAADESWRIEVYGVLDDHGYRWIQIGLTGTRSDMVTLRLVEGAGAQHAIMALTAWVAERGAVRNVLNVA
jgi:hypothetical protein